MLRGAHAPNACLRLERGVRPRSCGDDGEITTMLTGAALWYIGVPIPVLLLLWFFFFRGR